VWLGLSVLIFLLFAIRFGLIELIVCFHHFYAENFPAQIFDNFDKPVSIQNIVEDTKYKENGQFERRKTLLITCRSEFLEHG